MSNSLHLPTAKDLQSIAKRYHLRLIVLFGSQATRRTHLESDVDVAIWVERPLSTAKRNRLWIDLSKVFGADVDLTVLNHAEPLLLWHVATKGRLLYGSTRWAWPDFKAYAFRNYQDTQKFRDDLTRYLRREIQGVRYAG